jgi:hypothetical protein
MAHVAVRVENRSGKQTVSIFKRDQLTAMEMPGQNQVIAAFPRSFPDTRVVCTQDPIITLGHSYCIRARDRNHSGTMRHSNRTIVNPFTPAAHHRVTNSIHTDMAVVVSAYAQDWCDLAKRTDQITQLVQFRRLIYQVTAQQHSVHFGIVG